MKVVALRRLVLAFLFQKLLAFCPPRPVVTALTSNREVVVREAKRVNRNERRTTNRARLGLSAALPPLETALDSFGLMPGIVNNGAAPNGDRNLLLDWEPLVLSSLAGLSTCLGASVVFCAAGGKRRRGEVDGSSKGKDPSPPLSSRHLCFSIAFAGSVMVTVSLFSLLPESFADESASASTFLVLSPSARPFWDRVGSFFAGCGLCLVLSRVAFPEPDEILDLQPAAPEKFELLPDRDHPSSATPATNLDRVNNNNQRRQQSIVKRQSSVATMSDAVPGSSSSSVIVARTSSVRPEDEACLLEAASSYPTGSDSEGRCRWWSKFSSGSDLTSNEARRSWRVAILLFVSLLAHNFPEGFAVAATSVHSPKLGVTTAIAIAFHNIPEGIAIAVPCLAARPDSPWLAFGLASLSGLAEPLGAAVALLVLRGGGEGAASTLDIDSVLSFVAGVMVTVALNELFPEARRHAEDGKGPLWLGILAGAVVMLASDTILDATY